MRSVRGRNKNLTKRRSGQVFIEFAMGLTFVLMPLMVGVLQYGIIIKTTLALNNLSREVGRYSAMQGRIKTDAELQTYISDTAAKLKLVIPRVNNYPTDKSTVTITTTKRDGTATPAGTVPANREQYGNITVVITYDAKANGRIFLPNTFVGDPVLSSKSVMVMQN